MPFEYDKRFLTDEHAEYFVSLVQFACDEIAEGRMPDFEDSYPGKTNTENVINMLKKKKELESQE